MADLVTRLLLNSSQFDNNIRQSTQQVQQFQAVGRNITSTIGKFAASIGVAGGAMEVFNKMIESSVNFSDTMNKHLDGVKGTVDEFFYSLATGDFSAFYAGIDGIIQRATDAQQALRNLERATISYSYFRSENRRNIATAKVTANNTDLSTEEREVGFASWEKALSSMEADANKYAQKAVEAVQKQIAKGNTLIASTISKREIEQVIKLNLDDEEARKNYKEAYNYVESLIEDINAKYNVKQAGTNNKSLNDNLAKQKDNEIKAVQNKYRAVVIANEMLNKMSTEEFQSVVDMLNQSNDIIEELGSQREEYNNTYKAFKAELDKVTTTTNKTAKVDVKPIVPKNSLADIQQQISKLQANILLSVDPVTRANLYSELQKLENTKREIEFEYKFPNKPTSLPSNPVGNITSGTDLNIKIPNYQPVITQKDVKINSDYYDGLNAIATLMNSVTMLTQDSEAAWISWTANVLSSVAAALPAISTLVSAKTAEAGASAAASAAQTPVVGWLMAGTAVASVLAAIATLPSFSTGGIFTGNNTIGDYNLARVNAGEMILNNRQQRNLFNLLNGSSTNTTVGGEVSFKIRGTDLVGVINQTNNRLKKL